MEAITTIMILCNIRVKDVDQYIKHDCINYYTNCLVVENGRFAEEKINDCKKNYIIKKDVDKNGK